MPHAHHVLHHFSADAHRWADLQADAPRLGEAIAHHGDRPTWRDLLNDCFFLAWKPFPAARPVEDLVPSYHAHHPLIQGLLQDPSVAQLRASTRFDDWLSAVAALELAEQLAPQLPAPAEDADPDSGDIPTGGPGDAGAADGAGIDDPNAPPAADTAPAVLGRDTRVALRRALNHAQQKGRCDACGGPSLGVRARPVTSAPAPGPSHPRTPAAATPAPP